LSPSYTIQKLDKLSPNIFLAQSFQSKSSSSNTIEIQWGNLDQQRTLVSNPIEDLVNSANKIKEFVGISKVCVSVSSMSEAKKSGLLKKGGSTTRASTSLQDQTATLPPPPSRALVEVGSIVSMPLETIQAHSSSSQPSNSEIEWVQSLHLGDFEQIPSAAASSNLPDNATAFSGLFQKFLFEVMNHFLDIFQKEVIMEETVRAFFSFALASSNEMAKEVYLNIPAIMNTIGNDLIELICI